MNTIKCTVCSGTGINHYDYIEPGKHWFNRDTRVIEEVVCPYCGGKGFIQDKECRSLHVFRGFSDKCDGCGLTRSEIKIQEKLKNFHVPSIEVKNSKCPICGDELIEIEQDEKTGKDVLIYKTHYHEN